MRTIHASHVSGEIHSASIGRAKSAIWQLGQGLKLNRQIADLAKCKSLGDVVALSAQFYTLTLSVIKQLIDYQFITEQKSKLNSLKKIVFRGNR